MHERVREPARAEARRRQAEPEPPAHEVLALQRRLGNQAVLRLLSASRAVYGELHEAANQWRNSDPAVQQEFSARLREFKARLKGERLTTFAADLRRLKAENSKLATLVDPLL